MRPCGEADALYGSSTDDCSLRQRWRLGEPTGKTVSSMCYRPPDSVEINMQVLCKWMGAGRVCVRTAKRFLRGSSYSTTLLV